MKYLGKIQDNKDLVTKEYVDNKTPPDASTSQKGIVQLSDSTSGTSTTKAATESAVKAAYDHGGVTSVNGQTGAVTVGGGTKIIVSEEEPTESCDFWYQVIS